MMHSLTGGRVPVFVYMRMPEFVRYGLPEWIKEVDRPSIDVGKQTGRVRARDEHLESSGQVSVASLVEDLGTLGIYPARDGIEVSSWFKPGEYRLKMPFRHLAPRQLRLPSNLMHDLEHLFQRLTWVAKAGWLEKKGLEPEHFFLSLTRPTPGAPTQTILRVKDGQFELEPASAA